MNISELKQYLQDNSNILLHNTTMKCSENKNTYCDIFCKEFLKNENLNSYYISNIENVYNFLCVNKKFLIENNLISKEGKTLDGKELWNNYNFDKIN